MIERRKLQELARRRESMQSVQAESAIDDLDRALFILLHPEATAYLFRFSIAETRVVRAKQSIERGLR
jgi:hypothetical protein